jgi:hypothetical protein
VYPLSERAKINLLSFLLVLILGFLAITAIQAFQTLHDFQQQYNKVQAGDVSTMRPWMTIHMLSHVYHVPENYLDRSLTIDNPAQLRHATLYQIAADKRQSIDQVIYTAQRAILIYRKHQSSSGRTILLHTINRGSLLLMPRRTTS